MASVSVVAVVRCGAYRRRSLRKTLERALELLGGWDRFFRPGENLLLKPNLLCSSTPESAVCTHPVLMQAMASLLLDGGARTVVGDSPGLGDAGRVASACGLLDALRPLGVETVNFSASRVVGGDLFKRLELAEEALDTDGLVNVAKAKTHGQMVLTLAVKNLFGCVVGTGKRGWHLRAGKDRDWFARMLLEIVRIVRPRLSLVDGVVSMDGNGPAAGRPRRTGFICLGEDPVAVDAVVCDLLGVQAHHVRTVALAGDAGIGESDLSRIRIVGDDPADLRLSDFRLPPLQPVAPSMPSALRRRLESVFGVWPRIHRERCTGCGTCERACPTDAITMAGSRARVDRSRCISCFCCQEICPQRAISLARGVAVRLESLLRR